jgi:hypothetical protein
MVSPAKGSTMSYAIITHLDSGGYIRNALAPDAALNAAKEQGIKQLKRLFHSGGRVSGADITTSRGVVVSSLIMSQNLTWEYLGLLPEKNYLAAWSDRRNPT